MVLRPQYMNTLRQYRDVPLVKILAGISAAASPPYWKCCATTL